MTTHILFRFHKAFDVCAQNLKLLRKLNPSTPIHGMYGGSGGLESLPQDLTSLMDSVWAIPLEDPYNNWKNGDICIRWWFKDHGHLYPFSHLVVVEWDMLYFKPLEGMFGPLQPDANYMSLVDKYQVMLESKWPWIQGSWKWQVDAILKQLEEKGSPVDIETLTFGVMGGCVLSRAFLEAFSKETVFGYSNDEVRMSIYAKALDIPVLDNGFYSDGNNMFDASVEAGGKGFNLETIRQVLAKGGKTVHPVREIIAGLADLFG